MGSRHRPKGRSARSYQLQNHPYHERGRRNAQEIHQGTTRKRVYSEVQIPLRIGILLHQKEGWKAKTNPGLPKAESIHYPKQIPLTLDTGTDFTSQGSESLLEIRHTLGIQQCEDQRGRPTQSSIQDQVRVIRTKCDVFRPHEFPSNISSHDGPHTSTMGGQMGRGRRTRILVYG